MNASLMHAPFVRFLKHVLEMCLVMCAAAIVLNVIFFEGAWLFGHDDLRGTAPVLSSLFLTASLTVPMIVWMRFRKHDWQATIEMGASTVALAFVLFAGAAVQLIAVTDVFDMITRLACLAMIGVMLVRYDYYSGAISHAHHGMA